MSSGKQFVLILVLACPALGGCGGGTAPGTVLATGVVTLGGKPVAGANVIFYPTSSTNPGLACQAVTDDEGRFKLSTHVGAGKFQPGIAPGNYAVAITKLDIAGISNTLGPPKNLLPQKYGDPKTSKFSADVSPDHENNFDFKLSSE